MIYFKFILLLIASLLFKLVAQIIAPIIVLFAKSDGNLPNWLYWFGTVDHNLDGDKGWIETTRPIKIEKTKLDKYRNRVHWLWRNTADGFASSVLGVTTGFYKEEFIVKGDPLVTNGPLGKSGFVARYYKKRGKLEAFQFYYIRRYKRWPLKCIRINVGWKMFNGPDYSPLRFDFSPSIWMHFIA
jgi:hypothetical protein